MLGKEFSWWWASKFWFVQEQMIRKEIGVKNFVIVLNIVPHESNHLFSYLNIFFSMYWIPLLPKMRYCSWINQQRFRELLTELCIYLVGIWKPVCCLLRDLAQNSMICGMRNQRVKDKINIILSTGFCLFDGLNCGILLKHKLQNECLLLFWRKQLK